MSSTKTPSTNNGGVTSNHDNDPPQQQQQQQQQPKPYMVTISIRFLILTLLSSYLLSFTVGRAFRVLLLQGPSAALLWPHLQSSMRNRPDYHEGVLKHKNKSGGGGGLPLPQMMMGKDVPKTVYSSKNFDTAKSARSSSMLVERNPASAGTAAGSSDKTEGKEDGETCSEKGGSCSRGKDPTKSTLTEDDDEDDEYDDNEEEEHLPAGQHLLIDIKDVDGTFLNSEERLAAAMISVVQQSELTLLSYHCHTLVPVGVSCVGVLLESHVSFHTWPNEGVITLDLFTCGSGELLPVIQVIEELFAVPRVVVEGEEVVKVVKPGLVWSHKLRGFRDLGEYGETSALSSNDFGGDVLAFGQYDLKEELASVQTPFQRIDIYNLIVPKHRTLASYLKSLDPTNGSYESQNPKLYRPVKVVYLDGVLQSHSYGDAAYHESLVHPGLFSHPNPKRVGIIGGGEGATLREVLKHDTVEKCVMIEIDEMMVRTSREYLPEWSDCSDIVGSADWCVEDERADVRFEDAVAWFVNRFGEEDEEEEGEGEDGSEDEEEEEEAEEEVYDEEDYKQFDVIIMDALDPQVKIPFAEVLYQDPTFLISIYNALTEDGIMIMQLGDAPGFDDPPDEIGRNTNRARITELLQEVGFEALHVYEEYHSGFGAPWSYLVAMKDYNCRTNWYLNAAQVEIAIHERIKKTYSGKPALEFFDGPTMMTIQIPHRGFETVYCRSTPKPDGCDEEQYGFLSSRPNADLTSVEVRTSQIGDHAGRGVFAKVDIPKGTRIGLEDSVKAIYATPSTKEMIDLLHEEVGEAKDLDAVTSYLYGYGFVALLYGKPDVTVDSSILTFINHGCNGTHNVGPRVGETEFTEMNVDLESMPADLHMTTEPYDLVIARHMRHAMSSDIIALRDIKAGEELLSNYLGFTGSPEDWLEDIADLREQCINQGTGMVKDYEEGKIRSEE